MSSCPQVDSLGICDHCLIHLQLKIYSNSSNKLNLWVGQQRRRRHWAQQFILEWQARGRGVVEQEVRSKGRLGDRIISCSIGHQARVSILVTENEFFRCGIDSKRRGCTCRGITKISPIHGILCDNIIVELFSVQSKNSIIIGALYANFFRPSSYDIFVSCDCSWTHTCQSELPCRIWCGTSFGFDDTLGGWAGCWDIRVGKECVPSTYCLSGNWIVVIHSEWISWSNNWQHCSARILNLLHREIRNVLSVKAHSIWTPQTNDFRPTLVDIGDASHCKRIGRIDSQSTCRIGRRINLRAICTV